MKGSIQYKVNKKGVKTYYAVVAPRKGKRKWYKGGKTKRDAERILSEKLSELGHGAYKEPTNITFADFTIKWLRSIKHNIKPNTYDSYSDIIDNQLIPEFGTYKMKDITTGMLQSYITDRRDDVGSKTVRNEIYVITPLFRCAKIWENLYINPALEIIKPKYIKAEIIIMQPNEFKAFLEAAKGSHYFVAFLLDIHTGLRAGEVWGLRWSDIDWHSSQIHIRQIYSKGAFGDPKTKAGKRAVDITESLLKELRKWKLACPPNEHDLVFPSPDGNITDHDNMMKRYFEATLIKAGLPHFSFHSLRHTNVAIRIHANQNIKYIQEQIGHASIQVTLDIYGHLFKDLNFNRQQAALLDTAVSEAVSSSA